MKPFPIYDAAVCGDYETVSRLLAQDASLAVAGDENGFTALHGVAAEEEAIPMVQLLLNAGASIQTRNALGITPLHLATTAEMVAFLVDKGADVNAVSRDGSTPLHIMVSETDMLDPIRELLEKGAKASIKNHHGVTALDIAQLREETEVIALLEQALKTQK